MPNTTAVRKAKDIRAASTLSLVRSSIALPPASVDASCPAPTQESRDRFDDCQAKSLLQRNNSRLSNEVSGLPHLLMHNNHVNTSLIQEVCLSKCAVLTLHSDCRACDHPNPAPIASFKFLYRKKVAGAGAGVASPPTPLQRCDRSAAPPCAPRRVERSRHPGPDGLPKRARRPNQAFFLGDRDGKLQGLAGR
jgi:hypothetical protein